MEETFAPLTEELEETQTRQLYFCHTYEDTSHIYLYFESMLECEMADPVGYPNMLRFRNADMFTACTTPEVKGMDYKIICKS